MVPAAKLSAPKRSTEFVNQLSECTGGPGPLARRDGIFDDDLQFTERSIARLTAGEKDACRN